MTRFWAEGLPVQVEVDDVLAPRRFVWQAQTHPVERVLDRWRVDEDWWRGQVWREYFTLTTTSGLLVDLFHDLLTDSWRLQRLYD